MVGHVADMLPRSFIIDVSVGENGRQYFEVYYPTVVSLKITDKVAICGRLTKTDAGKTVIEVTSKSEILVL